MQLETGENLSTVGTPQELKCEMDDQTLEV